MSATDKQQERILLVDDDLDFTRLVKKYLGDAGYSVDTCDNGRSAVDYVAKQPPGLVVLDVMMPELDGHETCKQIRVHYDGPVLMLTALDEEVDEILGLELGADDYLRKPVSPRLLLARVRSTLRRKGSDKDPGIEKNAQHKTTEKIDFGGLELNLYTRNVRSGGINMDLTDLEFDLLAYLMQHQGEIVSRDQLYKDTMRIEYDGLDRTLDLRVSRLRKKLVEHLSHRVLIKTIRCQGYLLLEQS